MQTYAIPNFKTLDGRNSFVSKLSVRAFKARETESARKLLQLAEDMEAYLVTRFRNKMLDRIDSDRTLNRALDNLKRNMEADRFLSNIGYRTQEMEDEETRKTEIGNHTF